MKESMLRCVDYLEANLPDGRLVQTIHDELAFNLPARPGWFQHALRLKGLMEDWPMFSEVTPEKVGVPIKSNMAITTTTWEAKREVVAHPDGSFAWAA
jgi:hypothetical protein